MNTSTTNNEEQDRIGTNCNNINKRRKSIGFICMTMVIFKYDIEQTSRSIIVIIKKWKFCQILRMSQNIPLDTTFTFDPPNCDLDLEFFGASDYSGAPVHMLKRV